MPDHSRVISANNVSSVENKSSQLRAHKLNNLNCVSMAAQMISAISHIYSRWIDSIQFEWNRKGNKTHKHIWCSNITGKHSSPSRQTIESHIFSIEKREQIDWRRSVVARWHETYTLLVNSIRFNVCAERKRFAIIKSNRPRALDSHFMGHQHRRCHVTYKLKMNG